MIHSEIFWTVVCATVAAQAALFLLGAGIALAVNAVKRSRANRAMREAMEGDWETKRSFVAAREYPISGGVSPESMILEKPPSRTCSYCETVMVECAQPTADEIIKAPDHFYGIGPGRCPSCQSLQSGMAAAPWFRKGFLAWNPKPPACECPSCAAGVPPTPPPEVKP